MTPPAVNQPRRGYPRSAAGLLGALLAIFLLIAAVWGLTFFQRGGHPDPSPTIQYRPALVDAQAQAPFHLLSPDPVPAGLRATSVNWDGAGPQKTWQIGFLTAQDEFVGLYQGTGSAPAFIEEHTPASQPGAPVIIDGDRWLTLDDTDQTETAFVRTTKGVTVVVTGTAARSDLLAFVRSLR